MPCPNNTYLMTGTLEDFDQLNFGNLPQDTVFIGHLNQAQNADAAHCLMGNSTHPNEPDVCGITDSQKSGESFEATSAE